nr:unnamed protein product [Digitaria exilis]
MVMGTLTGNSALLQSTASVSAPPLDATSSTVRLRGGRSGSSCRTSLGLGGRAASRRASSRPAGPGAGPVEPSPPTATPGEMPNLRKTASTSTPAIEAQETETWTPMATLPYFFTSSLIRPENAMAAAAAAGKVEVYDLGAAL